MTTLCTQLILKLECLASACALIIFFLSGKFQDAPDISIVGRSLVLDGSVYSSLQVVWLSYQGQDVVERDDQDSFFPLCELICTLLNIRTPALCLVVGIFYATQAFSGWMVGSLPGGEDEE